MDRHRLTLNFCLSARPQRPFLPRAGSLLKPVLAALVLVASDPALAEIKVDTAAAASQQTSVGQSERGVAVINIANPNSNGLSHNRFELFNVDKPGAVFNNSLAAGVSQLGGALSANANLSRRAQVILNEVTGNQPSTLAGTLEVFGGKADVIVANPNGITLNGISTFNVHGLVASTGRPDLTNGLALNVTDGSAQVIVAEDGVGTQGLSYFDVVARVVALNGKIGTPGADANVQVVAGLNRYDSKQRSASPLSNSSSPAPGIAIDGAVAGAMYGRYITLLSSESGVGVRHAGLVRSSHDIVVQANGDIDLARANADEQISLASSSNVLINGTPANAGIQAGGAISISAAQGITLGANVQSSRFAANAASLQLNNATLRATGNDPANAAINIQVDDFAIIATLHAYDSIFGGLLAYGQPLVLKNGELQVMRTPGQYDDNFTLTSSATLASAGGIAITAKRVSNNQGTIEDSSSRGIQISTDTLNNSGIVRSTTDLNLSAGTLNNHCSDAAASQQICAGFFANGAATLSVGTLTNQAGLVAKGDLTVELGGGQHMSGTFGSMAAGNDLLLTNAAGATSQLNNDGELIATRHLMVRLDTLNNGLTAATVAFGHLGLDVAATFSNAGYLAAQGFAAIVAQDVQINSGARLVFAGGATLAARANLATQDHASIYSNGDLNLNAGANLTTAADIWSKDMLIMHADRTMTNTGSIVSESDIDLSSLSMMKNDQSGVIYAMNNLLFSNAGDLNNLNGAMMLSGQDATFRVQNTFLNDQSSIIEGGNVMIAANVMRNRHGSLIHGVDDLNIMVGNYQDTSEGSILQLGDRILVQANMDEKEP